MHQTIQGWTVSKLIEWDLEGKGPGLIEVVTEVAWEDKSSENVLFNLPHTNQIFTITPTSSVHCIMLLHYLRTNLYYLWNLGQLHIRHTHTVFDILLHVTGSNHLGNASNAYTCHILEVWLGTSCQPPQATSCACLFQGSIKNVQFLRS